jgi:periplasmic protein TonB
MRMETIGNPVAAPARSYRAAAVSAGLHLVVFAVIVHQTRHFIAPIRYPGTANGHNLVLSYLPGRAPKSAVAPPQRAHPLEVKPKITLHQPQKIAPAETATARTSTPSEHPDAASGADALGSGNISIALAKYFPRPRPDLSTLPDGAKGDVVLDITIDEQGKISDLKLVKGMEQNVDAFVIAAVRQWTFTPASRDGQPVASEQELHFHYEKG